MDDLFNMSDKLEDLKYQLQAWRSSEETRGLGIDVCKAKTLGSSSEAQKPTANAK